MSEIIDRVRAGRYEIPVLYMDNHLLVVIKPFNMPVQRDASNDLDVLTALKRYVAQKYDKPGEAYLGLCHRLDRPVGGVMAFARTSKAAARLTRAFVGREVDKVYLAVLEGMLSEKACLSDWLMKDEATGMVRVVPEGTPGAKPARLESLPLKARNGHTLAAIRLHTGRAHQIRVQHAHAGLPLWGDNRYGNGRPGEQIALYAALLSLTHPTLKTRLSFRAVPPETGGWAAFASELKGNMIWQKIEEAWGVR